MLERIAATDSPTTMNPVKLSFHDYEILESTVSEYFAVLDEEVKAAWNKREVVKTDAAFQKYTVKLGAFNDEVKKANDELSKKK